MTPRRRFHLLLGAVFLPALSLPGVWAVAVGSWRRAADDEARRWARRMLALASADTVVAAALVAVVAAGGLGTEMRTLGGPVAEEPAAASASDRVVIGVGPDRSYEGEGARVGAVLRGGPADVAGLRAGDVVVELDGEAIPDFAALRSAIAGLEPGVSVRLVAARGGERVPLQLVPRRASELPPPQRPALTRAQRLEVCAPHLGLGSLLFRGGLVGALALLAALVRWRARAPDAARAIGWTALALVVAAVAGEALASGACVASGGARTPGGILAAVLGSTAVLGATAAPGLRLVRGEGPPAARTWRSSVALGAWYLATGLPRVAALVGGATLLAALGPEDGPTEWLVSGLAAERAWGPVALFAVVAVVLAPIAEEIAFRGVLQPALGRWLGPAGAVAVSTLLFACAHWPFGPRLPVLLLVGAVLGWARVASGGLRAPIALHALVNAVNVAALVLLA